MEKLSDLYHRIETECPAYQTRVAARALGRYYNDCFRPLGITAEQFSLLVGIAGSERPTIAELAERGDTDATTISRSVHTLERTGLVRGTGGRGRTGKRLDLTDDGKILMEKAVAVWERAHAEMTALMQGGVQPDVRTVMSRLTQAAKLASTGAASAGADEPR